MKFPWPFWLCLLCRTCSGRAIHPNHFCFQCWWRGFRLTWQELWWAFCIWDHRSCRPRHRGELACGRELCKPHWGPWRDLNKKLLTVLTWNCLSQSYGEVEETAQFLGWSVRSASQQSSCGGEYFLGHLPLLTCDFLTTLLMAALMLSIFSSSTGAACGIILHKRRLDRELKKDLKYLLFVVGHLVYLDLVC